MCRSKRQVPHFKPRALARGFFRRQPHAYANALWGNLDSHGTTPQTTRISSVTQGPGALKAVYQAPTEAGARRGTGWCRSSRSRRPSGGRSTRPTRDREPEQHSAPAVQAAALPDRPSGIKLIHLVLRGVESKWRQIRRRPRSPLEAGQASPGRYARSAVAQTVERAGANAPRTPVGRFGITPAGPSSSAASSRHGSIAARRGRRWWQR